MLSQSEIKARREKHKFRILELRAEIEAEVAQLRLLYRVCKHPGMYRTSHMGETGTYCPDCGKQD